MKAAGGSLLRLIALVLVSALALQLFFLVRVALMAWVDPQSTTFQRSEIWRIATQKGALPWRQQWVPYDRIAQNLKRAVIASEDAGFAEHSGIEWDALEKAWERNQKAEATAERLNAQAQRHGANES
ncbi:MAG TPA: transglycosylase domain-containing protein, partial [Caldimonas sp.]